MDKLYFRGLTLLTMGGNAPAGDPISKFFNIILELVTPITSQVRTIAVVVILIAGLAFMLPIPKEYKRKAGGWLVFLIIGGLLVVGATSYAEYISGKLKF